MLKAKSSLRMRCVTWPTNTESQTIWNFRFRFVYSLYNFYGTTTIRWRSYYDASEVSQRWVNELKSRQLWFSSFCVSSVILDRSFANCSTRLREGSRCQKVETGNRGLSGYSSLLAASESDTPLLYDNAVNALLCYGAAYDSSCRPCIRLYVLGAFARRYSLS